MNDAGDGSEEADKRCRRRDRGQIAEAFLHLRGGHQRFALDGPLPRGHDVEIVRQRLRGLVLELGQSRAQHARQVRVAVPLVAGQRDRFLEFVLLEQRRDAESDGQRLALGALKAEQPLDGDGQGPDRHERQHDDHAARDPVHGREHPKEAETVVIHVLLLIAV